MWAELEAAPGEDRAGVHPGSCREGAEVPCEVQGPEWGGLNRTCVQGETVKGGWNIPSVHWLTLLFIHQLLCECCVRHAEGSDAPVHGTDRILAPGSLCSRREGRIYAKP